MGRLGGSYPQALRVRAVRMVEEHTADYPTQWAAILAVARELGCTSESLRRWVRQAERERREARVDAH
jgi:transposase